jgi:hypothetical protein
MDPAIIVAGIVLAVAVLLTLLRVNATLVFLSLCLGDVLMQFVGSDAGEMMNLFASKADNQVTVTSATVKIVLLLLPVVLTMLFMIKTVRGGAKLTLNFLPALGVGLVGALLIIPALPPGASHAIKQSDIWLQVGRGQDLIVGTTALICLFVLWLQRPKTGDDKHGKH